MSRKQSFCSFKYTKMGIEYGIASCTNELEESVMFVTRGNYMLVGWADLHWGQKTPVWRKI